MFFERNEIHIQVGVLFSNGKCSIFNPHLRKIIFKIYIQKITRQIEKIEKHNRTIWYLGHTDFENFRNFVRSILTKIIFVQDDSIIFLYFLKHFGDHPEVSGSKF